MKKMIIILFRGSKSKVFFFSHCHLKGLSDHGILIGRPFSTVVQEVKTIGENRFHPRSK